MNPTYCSPKNHYYFKGNDRCFCGQKVGDFYMGTFEEYKPPRTPEEIYDLLTLINEKLDKLMPPAEEPEDVEKSAYTVDTSPVPDSPTAMPESAIYRSASSDPIDWSWGC